jgi:glycosyltransferase involved in cell wall biosynthesis
VSKCLSLKKVQFTIPKILHYPVISKFIVRFGLSEKVRFHADSKQIAKVVKALHQHENFDIIESPNNGACFHKLRNLSTRSCIRIATTDKEHSIINRTYLSPYLKELFWAEGKTFRNCPNLVTHTQAHRDNICNEYKISPDKFTLIPLSVRIPLDSEITHSSNEKCVSILFVGRFESRKGIDIVLKVIPEILQKRPSVHFRLVGPDPDNQHQSNFLKNHPALKNNVSFLGEKRGDALDKEYKSCDIFFAPSRYESFGLVYAEAMSYAKPVIGTDIGGIPEVVENEKCGFLCKNEDTVDFTNKLLLLLRNEDLRLRMGFFARNKVKETFKFENMVSSTLNHYHTLTRK